MTQRRLVMILGAILLAYAGVALGRVLLRTFDPGEGYDFFSYWQPSQFLRQGFNPYTQAALGYRGVLRYPLLHLDGVTPDERLYDVLGSPHPANTPVMIFLLYPLALFTWETAKALWLMANLALLACSICLSVRIVTGEWGYLRSRTGVTYALVVLGMLAVRGVLGLGQTTLLIVTCMLLGLYCQMAGRRWCAGLALGIALAKFSLGMALFVYFVYKRQWLSLLIAVLFQAAGFALLALLTGTSLAATVTAYAGLAAALAAVEGIHLGAYVPWPPGVMAAAVTGVFAALLLLALKLPGKTADRGQRDLVVFALACNWAVLAVYHRYYDLALLMFGLMLFLHMASAPGVWGLAAHAQRGIARLAAGCALLLLLPGATVQPLLPAPAFAAYIQLATAAGTLVPY